MRLYFNLNLKQNKKTGKSLVVLIIRNNYKKVSISTGINIDTKSWDSKKQRVRTSLIESYQINKQLEKFFINTRDQYLNYYNENPKAEFRKLEIEVEDEELKNKKEYTFIELFDKYLSHLKSNDQIDTYKKLKTVKGKLLKLSKSKKVLLAFNELNQNFIDMYIEFLSKKEKLTNNTINKYIDNLKMFINWAVAREYYTHNPISKAKKLKSFQSEIIFLTEEELKNIEQLDLSHDKEKEKYRDIFIFGCYTGQRFSDYSTFDYNEVVGDFWERRQIKTKGKSITRIPLHPKAKNIIEKYRPTGFPKFDIHTLNRNLKIIAELASIDDKIKIVKYQGNNRIEKAYSKYELITTHTARRTFITLSLLKGMSIEAIMKISGHSSYKEFKKYLSILDLYVEDEFHKAWG